MEIPVSLVKELIEEQFPQWAHLPIHPVVPSGWDNRTFHLGDKMSVRLPSAERYLHQLPKEHKWLPKLAPQLPVPISTPLALGQPSKNYPWNWSVYKWLEGKNADTLTAEELKIFAKDIAQFLLALQKIDTTGGPVPTPGRRGAAPSYYDAQTRSAISELKGLVDANAAIAVWESALDSEWNREPVWLHGDYSAGNILVKDGRLSAVIDFGCCAVGDPACDLVIAWTFLNEEARAVFKNELGLEENTWARARGWAIWKALITLADLEDKNCAEAQNKKLVIDLVVEEHRAEH